MVDAFFAWISCTAAQAATLATATTAANLMCVRMKIENKRTLLAGLSFMRKFAFDSLARTQTQMNNVNSAQHSQIRPPILWNFNLRTSRFN